MTTLQEQFEKDYPDKEATEINCQSRYIKDRAYVGGKYIEHNFTNWDLDLKEYKNLEILILINNKLASVSLSQNNKLKELDLSDNNLTSVDFLNEIPNPEKLERLTIFNNKIHPTNIEIFSKFANLKSLRIGTMIDALEERRKHNRFCGSLKAFQNLTKLKNICIEATDVNEGLEYLPLSLAGVYKIECRPLNLSAKCSQIQNKLRPFNYDLEAWQLAHPHKIYKAKPEIFLNSELKAKWISALRDKTNLTANKLSETKKKEPQAVKRIKRLEMKLDNLKLIQQSISKDALIDKLQEKELVKKEDKATQTEYIILKNNG